MKTVLSFILVFFITFSCCNKNSQRKDVLNNSIKRSSFHENDPKNELLKSKRDDGLNKKEYKPDIINDEFSNNPLGLSIDQIKKGIDTASLKSKFNEDITIAIKPSGNILNFANISGKGVNLKFIQKENGLLKPYFEGEVSSDGFEFNLGVSIGMDKDTFCKKFNLNDTKDTIYLSSQDITSYFKFVFKENKLKKVVIVSLL